MKKLTTILLAMCLAACPASCLAEETEDYSYLEDMSVKKLKALDSTIDAVLEGESVDSDDLAYLEDMSVKELKALDSAISDVLGDSDEEDDSTADDPDTDEDIELTEYEEMAAELLYRHAKKLANPKSLKVNSCYFAVDENPQYEGKFVLYNALFDLGITNEFGAEEEYSCQGIFTVMTNEDWMDGIDYAEENPTFGDLVFKIDQKAKEKVAILDNYEHEKLDSEKIEKAVLKRLNEY